MNISQRCFHLSERNWIKCLRRFINVDGTWIRYDIPEPKMVEESAGKVMATEDWDTRGVVFVDCIGKYKENHPRILRSDMGEIEAGSKDQTLASKKVLF